MTSNNSGNPPDADFETDAEDFELDEVVFPYAPPQQWVIFCKTLTPEAIGVYSFIMAHVNPHTGKFDATPARARIAEWAEKSPDWVDKRLKLLVNAGAISKKWMYWICAHDHSAGKSVNPTDTAGEKRAQAPNRYRVHLKPRDGARYQGPIKVAEFYRPQLIERRVSDHGGAPAVDPEPLTEVPASTQPGDNDGAPGTDGTDSASPQVNPQPSHGGPSPQPPHSGPGGPPHSGPGDRHTAAQKNTGGKTTGPKNTGVSATADATLRFGVLANEPGGNPANYPANQPNQGSNHLTARARTKAGPGACQAIEDNPRITQTELAAVIQQEQPGLSRGQVIGRAATLLSCLAPSSDSVPPAAPHTV